MVAKQLISLASSLLHDDAKKAAAEPEVGSVVIAEGIAATDLAQLLGNLTITGVYIGNGYLYDQKHHKKLYRIQLPVKRVLESPTPETIAIADKYHNLLRERREQDKQRLQSEAAEREKNFLMVINILEKIPGVKKATHPHARFAWELSKQDPNVRTSLNEFFMHLKRLDYRGSKTSTGMYYRPNKIKTGFPTFDIDGQSDDTKILILVI